MTPITLKIIYRPLGLPVHERTAITILGLLKDIWELFNDYAIWNLTYTLDFEAFQPTKVFASDSEDGFI